MLSMKGGTSIRRLTLLLTLCVLQLSVFGTQVQAQELTRPGSVTIGTVDPTGQTVALGWGGSSWVNDPSDLGGRIFYWIKLTVTGTSGGVVGVKKSFTDVAWTTAKLFLYSGVSAATNVEVSVRAAGKADSRMEYSSSATASMSVNIISAPPQSSPPQSSPPQSSPPQSSPPQSGHASLSVVEVLSGRLNPQAGAPVIVYGSSGQLSFYGHDGSEGVLMLTTPAAASLAGSPARELGSFTNSYTDKLATVSWDGTSVVLSTAYADTPHDTDKPYIIRFDAGNEVAIIAW